MATAHLAPTANGWEFAHVFTNARAVRESGFPQAQLVDAAIKAKNLDVINFVMRQPAAGLFMQLRGWAQMVEYLLAKGATGACVDAAVIACARDHLAVGVQTLIEHISSSDTRDKAINAFCENYGGDALSKDGLDVLAAMLAVKSTSLAPRAIAESAIGAQDINATQLILEHSSQQPAEASRMLSMLTASEDGFVGQGLDILGMLLTVDPAKRAFHDAVFVASRSYNTNALRVLCRDSNLYASDALVDLAAVQDSASLPRRETMRYLTTLVQLEDALIQAAIMVGGNLDPGALQVWVEGKRSISTVVQTALITIADDRKWLSLNVQSCVDYLLHHGEVDLTCRNCSQRPVPRQIILRS